MTQFKVLPTLVLHFLSIMTGTDTEHRVVLLKNLLSLLFLSPHPALSFFVSPLSLSLRPPTSFRKTTPDKLPLCLSLPLPSVLDDNSPKKRPKRPGPFSERAAGSGQTQTEPHPQQWERKGVGNPSNSPVL